MGAIPVTEAEAPEIYTAVRRAAAQFDVPMPAILIIDSPEPKALETGRNPRRAAVAATTGLLPMLDERELYGVMTHEVAHIRNRNTMWSSMAAIMCYGVILTIKPGWWISYAMAWVGSVLVHLSNIFNWGYIGTLLAWYAAIVGHFARLMASAINWVVDLFVRLLQSAATREREHFAMTPAGELVAIQMRWPPRWRESNKCFTLMSLGSG